MEKPTIDLIFQVALCVDDLESVVEQWKELFDLDTATIVRKCTKDAYESDGWDGLNYNEAPCQSSTNTADSASAVWISRSSSLWTRRRGTRIQIF